MVKNKLIIYKIIDLQSNPIEKNPYKTGGITQVTFCVTGDTNPKSVAKYASPAIITGHKILGINKIGFNTVGNPYITGSPILKRHGTIPNLATSL